MRMVGIEQAVLDACIHAAQHERIVLTREGKPVALLVGVEGMDQEQLDLGSDVRFWELISERRSQPAISRSELEQRISQKGRDH